jgi:GNAT superfamily N-acetyltransferase
MGARVQIGIDGAWLTRQSELEPFRHAWAVWDLARFPERVEFRTLEEDGRPTAYLLLWHGSPNVTVVHWVGDEHDPGPLLESLPPRPIVAVVPERVASRVVERRGPASARPILAMVFDIGTPVPPVPKHRARRLVPGDRSQLEEFARRYPDTFTSPYATLDPAHEPLFGAFEDEALVAVARAQVALPTVWVIGGIYVRADRRGQYFGADVTRVAVAAALATGALPTLYVREDNVPARRIYEPMGFRPVDRRIWIEAPPQ